MTVTSLAIEWVNGAEGQRREGDDPIRAVVDLLLSYEFEVFVASPRIISPRLLATDTKPGIDVQAVNTDVEVISIYVA